MEHPFDMPNKTKLPIYRLKRMIKKDNQYLEILRRNKLFPFENNFKTVRDMENYIETKLFTNLRQRLKRNNPKYQIGKLKLQSDREQLPVTSKNRVPPKKSKVQIIIDDNEAILKSKQAEAMIRLSTPATRTQTIPSSKTSKRPGKPTHARIKSAYYGPAHKGSQSNLNTNQTSGPSRDDTVTPRINLNHRNTLLKYVRKLSSAFAFSLFSCSFKTVFKYSPRAQPKKGPESSEKYVKLLFSQELLQK